MTISIDDDVATICEQIRALRQLGDKHSVSDREVYDVSIRWGAALAGRLPRLAHYSGLGLLTDADEQRFAALCDDLRAVAPLTARFGIACPSLPETPAGIDRKENADGTTR
jgi:hypothetical protein